MQFTHVVISLIFSIASPSSAETTWKDDSADLTLSNSDIFDNHEASPSFDPDLFSNADPLNTNLDDFSSSINFLTEAGVNDHAAASCLSSSFGNSLAVNDLQARSSPKCPNPLQNSDSGILNINTILDPEDLEEFSNDYTIPWTEPNLHVCPYERYGYRSLPLCDSGSQYDIVEDAFVWNIDLINPSACMYDFIIALLCHIECVCICCFRKDLDFFFLLTKIMPRERNFG